MKAKTFGMYPLAMGGLWFPLLMQWRIFKKVFRCIPDWRSAFPDQTAFHINIHEFIALITNNFFMMMSFTNLYRQGSPVLPNINRWIFLLEADNTSALSWMYRISCMWESHIVNFCHLFYHIVFCFNTIVPSCFDCQHIAGILNVEAEDLYFPQYHPAY